ncbi:MAG TPA: hypothetical protein DEQ20_11180, partial [Desulfobulbaceae bacterium]|nr:hypothetical protein [Desulfobulbaceae bacterium]
MDWNTVIGVAAAFAGFAVVRGIREAFRNKSNKPAQEQFADVNQQYSLINDESINANNAAEDAKSNGIGGWLILVAIGIISDPIVSLFFGGCKIVC